MSCYEKAGKSHFLFAPITFYDIPVQSSDIPSENNIK